MAFSSPRAYSRLSGDASQLSPGGNDSGARTRRISSSSDAEDRLDFEQAMHDFRRMFPSLETEVIEAVLRTNNGAVDDTIDQLLVMTMEDEHSPSKRAFGGSETETVPKTIDDSPDHPEQLYLNIPRRLSQRQPPSLSPPASIVPVAKSDPRLTPAMSTQYSPVSSQRESTKTSSVFCSSYLAQNQRGPITNIPEPNSISTDLLLNEFLGPPPSYDKVTQSSSQFQRQKFSSFDSPAGFGAASVPVAGVKQKQKKRYHPPLVGELPDDFLRFTEDFSLDVIYDDILEKKMVLQSEAKKKKSLKSTGSFSPDLSRFGTGGGMGIFRTSGKPRKHQHKGLEHCNTGSGISDRRRKQYRETEKQADKLKEMMVENQFRRQAAHDPELEQYLEDERIAMMLQNREFMKELRRNKDFAKALERDAAFVNEDKMIKKAKKLSLRDRMSSGSSSSSKSPRASRKSDSYIDIGPVQTPAHKYEEMDSSSREESIMEGYGDEEPVSADPFPFTKTVPRGEDNDVMFKEKLKYMSKSSKQKFAMMARKFTRKSKGAKGIFGTSDSHHTNMSLLDSTDDFDIPGEDMALQAGYNQPNTDDDYQIGQTRDLKEGRLFSR